MSTATVEEFTSNPAGILSRVAAGEMLCVFKGSQMIAQIIPAPFSYPEPDDGEQDETLHLLSTPANSERIRQGLADYAAGNLHQGELCN